MRLEAIKFNHDPDSASTDALNIRRNSKEFVPVPEWRRGVSVEPDDSPSAYAARETSGKTVTIQAKFSRDDNSVDSMEVRALDFNRPPMNVLGEVKARVVNFGPSGETGFESFELSNVRIGDVGVGAHTVTWRWQFRTRSDSGWVDLKTSTHKVYTILEEPKSPWQQTPYHIANGQIPWTEVLDWSCAWAAGAMRADDAAAHITRGIYGLGPTLIEYNCPGSGTSNYSYPHFNCTSFLDLLRGGFGRGRYVNCSDCATIVSTFANILGCDLWQSRMGSNFSLNPILAIGSSRWETACGWGAFSYHEVAWKGACTLNDNVFDACLQVDGDVDPSTSPHTPLLPMNIRFGRAGDGRYRDMLAANTPGGRPRCEPQPSTRVRRKVI